LKSTGLVKVSGLWETIGMPKKEEHFQTHQNREAQKLVDRIEKKASTAQRLTTPKRDLRVVKWIGTVPAIGVCTYCGRQFQAPLTAVKSVPDAQENLRVQFTEHKCKRADANQAATRQELVIKSN
jgi:hypothetical protein